MYASIEAVGTEYSPSWDEPSKKKSKSMVVKSEEFDLSAYHNELHLRAQYSEDQGTGERGGRVKSINRELVLNLRHSDLKKILNFAIQEGLISIGGRDAIENAIELLNNALSEMNKATQPVRNGHEISRDYKKLRWEEPNN